MLAEQYDMDWVDIFSVQSEVAQLVASQIEAVITPDEKQRIENIPTVNLTAYDLWMKGNSVYHEYLESLDPADLVEAERYFFNALEHDSTFALAYDGLACTYFDKQSTMIPADYDSCFQLLDIALSYDNQLSSAYVHRGIFFHRSRPDVYLDHALNEYNKALRYNPNDHVAYEQKGVWYLVIPHDFAETIVNFYEAAKLHRGPRLGSYFGNLFYAFQMAGYPEQANFYTQEAFKLNGDSVQLHYKMGVSAHHNQYFYEALERYRKAYALDTSNWYVLLDLGSCYYSMGKYEESLFYFEKSQALTGYEQYIHYLEHLPVMAYTYWMNGKEEEAEELFRLEMELFNYHDQVNSMGSVNRWYNYNLAKVYAFWGEKELALKNLDMYFSLKTGISARVNYDLKTDPLFNNLRNEPRFRQIIKEAEIMHNTQHERVGQWLKDNDML
jgi:tetratricopeptide (TPR) repeat protein